jgi:hypothetical protein
MLQYRNIPISMLFAIFLSLPAFSQWTTPDASNNIRNTNTGNVGIGTSTPAYPLDVTGGARFSGTSFINTGLQVTGNPNSWPAGQGTQLAFVGGTGYITAYDNTAGQYMPLYVRGSDLTFIAGGSPRAKLFGNGNFVINSSGGTPLDGGYKLDVFGSIRASGPWYFNTAQNMTASPSGNWDFNNGSGAGWYFRWINGGITAMTLSTANNLLLNTTTDAGYRLDVNGTTRLSAAVRLAGLTSDNTQTRIVAADANGNLFFRDASTLGSGSSSSAWSLTGNTAINPTSTFLGSTDNTPLAFRTNNVERFRIDGSGNIGIGTSSPQSLLSVKGIITAQKIVVTPNGWADYVFHPNYKLLPLPALEQYVHDHRHLPEIPSADSVMAKGADLGDNQVLLLKKIEELTLYIIDQNKKIQALTTRLEALENK